MGKGIIILEARKKPTKKEERELAIGLSSSMYYIEECQRLGISIKKVNELAEKIEDMPEFENANAWEKSLALLECLREVTMCHFSYVDDSHSAIEEIVKEHGLDPKVFADPKTGVAERALQYLKDRAPEEAEEP